MGLLEFLKNRASQNEDFKAAQRSRKINKILDDREKSSNERVMEKMMEEERQKKITVEMKKMQEQRNNELFSGGMSPEKNIFLGHKNVLHEDRKMIGSGNLMEHGRGMFFK